jgi:hypothetical protein
MKENARHGFWNGSLPPMGYRIVEAAEQPGHRTKKTLVGLIFRLAREADGSSRPMGVRSIVASTSAAGIPTRDGGRWGRGAVHKVLTRTTYIGRHRLNTKVWKTRERKPDSEVVEISVPPIVAASDFEAVQHPWPGTNGAARRQQSDTAHWYSFGASGPSWAATAAITPARSPDTLKNFASCARKVSWFAPRRSRYICREPDSIPELNVTCWRA